MGHPGFGADLPAVFPDWSPYSDLESAARAYLRDPDVALDAMAGVLPVGSVLSFTLERFVNETNGVWQEVAACDGTRLVLWHGEDVPPGEGPAGSMTSSIRVLPMSVVAEVGTRRRLQRASDGTTRSTRSTCTCCSRHWTTAVRGQKNRADSRYARTRCGSSRRSKMVARGRSPAWRTSPVPSQRWWVAPSRGEPPSQAMPRSSLCSRAHSLRSLVALSGDAPFQPCSRAHSLRSLVALSGGWASDFDRVCRSQHVDTVARAFLGGVDHVEAEVGRYGGAGAGGSQEVSRGVLDVGEAVYVKLEHLGCVLHAQSVAGAEVLIHPDLQRLLVGRRRAGHVPLSSPAVKRTPGTDNDLVTGAARGGNRRPEQLVLDEHRF